jgi:hypothetical protein
MRRLIASAAALPILVLLLAGPVAAAPPVKDSGTQVFFSAFSTDCGPSTCTETFVDVFQVSDESLVVCLFQATFNIHTGRAISEDGACSEEVSGDALVVADDLSSASVSPTDVTFFNCNQQGCTEGDTVTVSAELTGSGPIFTDRTRSTFSDGTCTVTFTSSGEQRQATGTITLDGDTLAADGNIGIGKFSVMERCR